MKKILYVSAFFFIASIINSCGKIDVNDLINPHSTNKTPDAHIPLNWYKLQLRFLLERNTTLNGVYFGYIGIGLYESVRYGLENSVSFSTQLYQMPGMPSPEKNNSYDWQVSANAALASMIRSFNVGLTTANLASIDSLEKAYNNELSTTIASASFDRSQSFGRAIATAIYNWYLTDNINLSNTGYVPKIFPGAWEPTPPAFANGIMPFLSTARTYLTSNLTGIAPPFPALYSIDPQSDYYKIAKSLYDVSQNLTADQKNTALYYIDQGNGIGYTPAGHDFSVVTQVIEQSNANLLLAAEAYARAGIAERDATVVCFRSKYEYSLIRPVTYIRRYLDPNWLPFIVTPPHPEYPAAHSFITGSVMQSITGLFGGYYKITDHTYDFRGFAPRLHDSLFAVAEDAGISRLYGGIHYLTSINIGLLLGRDLGNKVAGIKLHN